MQLLCIRIRAVRIGQYRNCLIFILIVLLPPLCSSKNKRISRKDIPVMSVTSDFNDLTSAFLSKRKSETKLKDTHVPLKIKPNVKPDSEEVTIQSIQNKPEKLGSKNPKIKKNVRQAAAPVNPIIAIEPLFSLLPFSIAPIVYVLFAMIITNLSLAGVTRGTVTENLNNAEAVMDNINAFTGVAGKNDIIQKKKGKHGSGVERHHDSEVKMLSSEDMFDELGFAPIQQQHSSNYATSSSSPPSLLSQVTTLNLIRLLGTALAISYVFEMSAGPALFLSSVFIGSLILTRQVSGNYDHKVAFHSQPGSENSLFIPHNKNLHLVMYGPG